MSHQAGEMHLPCSIESMINYAFDEICTEAPQLAYHLRTSIVGGGGFIN